MFQMRVIGILAGISLLGACRGGDAATEIPVAQVRVGEFIQFASQGRELRGFVTAEPVHCQKKTCAAHVAGTSFTISLKLDPSFSQESGATTLVTAALCLPADQPVRVYTPSDNFRKACLGVSPRSTLGQIKDLVLGKYLGRGWQGYTTNGFAVITGYTGKGGTVKIPSRWQGVPVREIGTGFWQPLVFSYPATEIRIPEGVTAIADYAFANHTFLTNVVLPASLTKIGSRAFEDCAGLRSITIPVNVSEIGHMALAFCLNLHQIEVVSGNSSFSSRDGVLYDKEGVRLIQFPAGRTGDYQIPEGVTEIGENAFSFATNLTHVSIPLPLTKIGSFAFQLCDSMTNIMIPASVTTIGEGAFGGCLRLTEISVPKGSPSYLTENGNLYDKNKTTLVQYAYGKKESSFTVPLGVQQIGNYAFWNCTNLTNVTLPEGVTKIGRGAFQFAQNLHQVAIPMSVTTIDEDAFSCHSRLDERTLKQIQEIQNNQRK